MTSRKIYEYNGFKYLVDLDIKPKPGDYVFGENNTIYKIDEDLLDAGYEGYCILYTNNPDIKIKFADDDMLNILQFSKLTNKERHQKAIELFKTTNLVSENIKALQLACHNIHLETEIFYDEYSIICPKENLELICANFTVTNIDIIPAGYLVSISSDYAYAIYLRDKLIFEDYKDR